MELSFYRMESQDLPFFLEVRNLVKDQLHDPREFGLAEALDWLSKTPIEYWIINLEGAQVGYFRILRHDKSSWQIGADIHPSFQRQGIATHAYESFIKEVILREISPPKFLDLKVLKKNLIAYSLYLKLGFVVISESSEDIEMSLQLGPSA
jgi:hypothetical protein